MASETGDRGVNMRSERACFETPTVAFNTTANKDAMDVFAGSVLREDRELKVEEADREMTVRRCWPEALRGLMVGAIEWWLHQF